MKPDKFRAPPRYTRQAAGRGDLLPGEPAAKVPSGSTLTTPGAAESVNAGRLLVTYLLQNRPRGSPRPTLVVRGRGVRSLPDGCPPEGDQTSECQRVYPSLAGQ